MCGRFALDASADELEQQVLARVPELNGWAQHPLNLNASASTSSQQQEQRPATFRSHNYNVAPQTDYPVLYRPHTSDGGLASPVLKMMRWGLQPHWLTSKPDYASSLKTINARDDSVRAPRGMWSSIRHQRRCVIFVSGFYEWLKKPNSNERTPHYTKQKEGLMCFAGLWDSVRYKGEPDELFTFTIITTDSNSQLSFLHDRMPVILPDKNAIDRWLDVSSGEFGEDVANLMKPFGDQLDCYIVPKEVGKVGNNSEDFIKPVAERKGNIASFFAKQAASSPQKGVAAKKQPKSESKPPGETSKRKMDADADEARLSPAKKRAQGTRSLR